jgi:cell shape-determining protein MreC
MENTEPMGIVDLATKMDKLTEVMQAGFAAIDKKIDAVDKMVDAVKNHLEIRMDRQFEELKERTLEPDQKEGLVAALDTFNQQLEDSALGTKDITLTRPEYDATSVVADFPNRFTTPAKAFAD